jgi:asparagine synthase (glutamine-hydrolysing)
MATESWRFHPGSPASEIVAAVRAERPAEASENRPMCGIAGYVTPLDGATPPPGILHRMNTGIRHRGPDDEGFFEAPGIGLAMRRLSIVDLAGSRQPVANEDGTVHVVFNGEIYNYVELRQWLLARGHKLATEGDTEVLVHLYEELGVEMLTRLRGMFAFALWDAKARKLLLARDRLGKKPLCYAPVGKGLRFCSEIAPLAGSEAISRELDPAALARYLTLGYVPSPLTIHRGIRKLPPGCFLTWQEGRMRIETYWRLSFARNEIADPREARERIREKLDESIRMRLRSDVPVGLLLSGGLDSNAVLARLVKGLGRRVTTFTVGFDDPRFDESDLARRSAKHFGVPHHVLPGRPELLSLLPKLVRHYGEPFADKSALPSLMLCELTRREVKVALNGDGGDEAFAGYDKYRRTAARGVASWLPRGIRQHWIRAALSGAGIGGGKLARNLRRRLLPDTESVVTSEFFAGRTLQALITPEFREHLAEDLRTVAEGFWDGPTDPVTRMLAWDYNHYLADDLLVKIDIASMASGLEVRSPFLDHELVELCAGLPSAWKVDSQGGKHLLRALVEEDIPRELMAAPKRGFSLPLEQWWRREAREDLRDGLRDLHPGLRCFINADSVRSLLDDHQRDRRNHAQRLWCLWILNAWAHALL